MEALIRAKAQFGSLSFKREKCTKIKHGFSERF